MAAARTLRGETAVPLDGSARLTFRLLWAAGTLRRRKVGGERAAQAQSRVGALASLERDDEDHQEDTYKSSFLWRTFHS